MTSDKPKILIFSIAYFPYVGGAEVAIKEITDRISDFEFGMVTLRFKKDEKEFERIGNVNVCRISCSKVLFPFYAYRKAKELHQLRDYQIVWGMMANLAGLGALIFKLWLDRYHKNTKQHKMTPKFLLTLQTGNDDKKVWRRTWWWRPLYKMIYRKADYIQAISRYLADRAKRMGAGCPIEVVPNGVDLDKFEIRSTKSETNPKLEIQNLKPDDKIIVTASRLVEKNGIAGLIKAAQLSIINYQLLIAGIGELEDDLKDLVRELKLEYRVKFLGQVSHEELAELYRRADVFVRPSLSEGLGSAFLEAMGAGVPVIATPVGGIPDFLTDGVTGWFCEVKSPKSIAEKINYVLDEKNKDKVYRVVKNARKLVEEKYSWDNVALKMENIFKSLITQ